MGWKVEIDIENLEKESVELGRLIKELSRNLNETRDVIGSLANFWEGDAAQKYISKMFLQWFSAFGLYNSLSRLKAAVDRQIQELRDVDTFFEKIGYEIFCN